MTKPPAIILLLSLFLASCTQTPNQSANPDSNKPGKQNSLVATSSAAQSLEFNAKFAIYTDSFKRSFTKSMYHNLSKDAYISPKDVETVIVSKNGTTWQEFFDSLPLQITTACLVTGDNERLCNTADKSVKFFLNNQRIYSLEVAIKPDDRLLISYGAEQAKEINRQLNTFK